MRDKTIKPKVSAIPTWVISPPEAALMTMAPVPAKSSAKVPKASAEQHRIKEGAGAFIVVMKWVGSACRGRRYASPAGEARRPCILSHRSPVA